MLQKMKQLLVIGIAAMSLAFVVPNVANAGGLLKKVETSDHAGTISGDSFDFLGQSAGYNSGGSADVKGFGAALFGKVIVDSEAKVIAGLGDTDLDLINLGWKNGVGFTNTVEVGAEGTGIAMGNVSIQACGLLPVAYGKIELSAFQENWSNAENHNLFDWNGDYGQASAYNTSTATTTTEKLKIGLFRTSIDLCDVAVTHGETMAWVTVGNNYVQSGAFSGNNYGIGDKLTAQGQVATNAVVTTANGAGQAYGTASFSGSDGFAASLATVKASHGVIVATSHSHAESN